MITSGEGAAPVISEVTEQHTVSWWRTRAVRVIATTVFGVTGGLAVSGAEQETGGSGGGVDKPHLTAFGEAVHGQMDRLAAGEKLDWQGFVWRRKNYNTVNPAGQFDKIQDEIQGAMLSEDEEATKKDKAARSCFAAATQMDTKKSPLGIIAGAWGDLLPKELLQHSATNYTQGEYTKAREGCDAITAVMVQNPFVHESNIRTSLGKAGDDRTIYIFTTEVK